MTATGARAHDGPLRPPIPWDRIGHPGKPPGAAAPGPGHAATSRAERPASAFMGVGYALLVLALALYLVDPVGIGYGSTAVGVPVAVGLLLIVLPLLRRTAVRETTFDLAGIMFAGFSAKLVATYVRFSIAVDALEYNKEGKVLAESFRRLDFLVDTGREVPGTGSVRYLVGLVHVATGSTFFASFLLFSFISYLGLYWFYRAFETGFPAGDHKRYALLVFLWPTVVFWPASMGKDSLVVSAIGLASWGVARLLQRQHGGLILTGTGVLAATMVRPHVALIIVIALLAALLLRRTGGDPIMRLLAKVVALAIVIVGGAILSSATAEFLNLENLGIAEVTTALDSTVTMTNQGGSAFTPPNATNPVMFPAALVTVLFRPLPGEVDLDLEGLLSSGTCVFLMLLCLVSYRRILSSFGRLRSESYLMYALTYVLVFVFVFSVVGNFGILDRQRAQVLPLLFVLLATPLPLSRARRGPPSSGAAPLRVTASGSPRTDIGSPRGTTR